MLRFVFADGRATAHSRELPLKQARVRVQVLDPDVPVPRLLAITNGDGSQPPAFGPPTLARLAAASLRASLDATLETIHALSIVKAATPSLTDSTTSIETGTGTGFGQSPPPAPSSGARQSPMPSPPGSPSLAALQAVPGQVPYPRPRRGPRRVRSWGGASSTAFSNQLRSRQLRGTIPEEDSAAAVTLGMLLSDSAPRQQQQQLHSHGQGLPSSSNEREQQDTVNSVLSASMPENRTLVRMPQLNVPLPSAAAPVSHGNAGVLPGPMGSDPRDSRRRPQRSISCQDSSEFTCGATSIRHGPQALDAYLRGAGLRLQALQFQKATAGSIPAESKGVAAAASPDPSSSQGRSAADDQSADIGSSSINVSDSHLVTTPGLIMAGPSSSALAAQNWQANEARGDIISTACHATINPAGTVAASAAAAGNAPNDLDIGALLLEVDREEAQKSSHAVSECAISGPPISRCLPAAPEHGIRTFQEQLPLAAGHVAAGVAQDRRGPLAGRGPYAIEPHGAAAQLASVVDSRPMAASCIDAPPGQASGDADEPITGEYGMVAHVQHAGPQISGVQSEPDGLDTGNIPHRQPAEEEEENWTIAAIPSPMASPMRPTHSPGRLSLTGHLPHRRALSLGSSISQPAHQTVDTATAQGGSLREVYSSPHHHVDPMVAKPVQQPPAQSKTCGYFA